MLPIKQPVRQVTVTGTATSLWELMKTVDSTLKLTSWDIMANAIEIQAQGGKVRYSINGEPTDTTGLLLNDGYVKTFRGVTPKEVYLVLDATASPTTYVNVDLGKTNSD